VTIVLAWIFLPGVLKHGQPAPGAAQTPASSTPSQSEPGGDRSSLDVLIASGYVVAHHKIEVGSKVMGKVAWIGVEKGDKVTKSQLLVRLDDREYRAQVGQARAALRGAQAALAELEAGYRPEEIQRAEAEVNRIRADLENARLELKRVESLLASGAASQQQVDNSRSRVEVGEAALRAAEKSHQLYRLGPRAEQIELARAEVERSKASVEYMETLLDATLIRAPISGTVLERLVETGEMVTTSFAGEMGAKSAVVSLADLNDLQVELDISQADFNRISRDQDCVMSPEAYPDRKYRCRIDEIAPEANRVKATIQVKVKVLEPDAYLRPEMTAQVRFSRRATADNRAPEAALAADVAARP
jgi:HlyD family secretion protein